ncbi:hypothetical protein L3X38_036509 [Prunus dulcis]|uniref:Retrotransposon gag domain-containing protein n=1 Tax=Prunus dulcis TaxID=3755 RepID=A0AAD4V3N1_PRUDU|nr:hypothetical protein L3X38_036509 [Prunus dulcis]
MNVQQSQNGIGRATAVDPNHVVVEEVTEADGGPVLRLNLATSLEIQQLIRVMETSNQLNHQRLQDMAQTIATQNAQINERFDRLLGHQNGQNGNQVAPNGVLAVGPQVEVQPNVLCANLGANPPQPNPPAGGNLAPVINVPPIGNNPYVGANQFQGFLPYNQLCLQVHQGAGVNIVGPHINQFARIGRWNNLGGNANLNNPPLRNQAIDRGAIEQMIQDIVPHARRIGRPVYRRPYPEHFDREEFPRGFKVLDFVLFSGDGFQSSVEYIGRLTAQCAEIGHREALKLRLFPSTLTGAAFSWYVKLPQNSFPNWQTMEQIFHEQFYRPEPEVLMADLAKMHQGSNESVQEYLGKFREAKARCTVNMPEHEFVKLAQGGLLLDLRKKFEGIEFCDIYDLRLQVDRYEALLKEEQQKNRPTSWPTFYRDLPKPSTSRTTAIHVVDIKDVDSKEINEEVFQEEEEELAGINLAEIVASGPHVCKALSKASKDQRPMTVQISKFSGTSQKRVGTKSYTFDISKAELIFDQLLKEKRVGTKSQWS